ncbi:hypothetical protein [Mycoplasma simbae]|uniref:hypothetical protein n=1 Tax=Mycoplasma simbae TaxID=36744 RepID=UPI0004971B74|nr:hypothetical protein [Mycoplasma simbae]
MLVLYLRKNFTLSRLTLIFVNLLAISASIMLVILGLDQVMLSQGNEGFNYINSDLSLIQIFATVQVCIAIGFLAGALIQMWIVLYKLTSSKKARQREVNNV